MSKLTFEGNNNPREAGRLPQNNPVSTYICRQKALGMQIPVSLLMRLFWVEFRDSQYYKFC